ncbi:MAG: NlpC/P60 family protein [Deltaproteobacteria bacterium]|nr:NlpC/P60 family protein [Deltaproteobacteria bacterium]
MSLRLDYDYLRILGNLFMWGFMVVVAQGCANKSQKPVSAPIPSETTATLTGYTIQVGAFRNVDNAVLLTRSLEARGIDAYYFRTKENLIKVRFGDFSSLVEAKRRAGQLVRAGVIDDYYVVPPNAHALSGRKEEAAKEELRTEIVETARSFIGLPYRWGGNSVETGFDCSGLVMAVYYLNGITLPRTSGEQYRVGKATAKDSLNQGDLVFFDTIGGNRVSHVGIYVGDGKFIHAPGNGRTIRTDSLSNVYYAPRYRGGRSCL